MYSNFSCVEKKQIVFGELKKQLWHFSILSNYNVFTGCLQLRKNQTPSAGTTDLEDTEECLNLQIKETGNPNKQNSQIQKLQCTTVVEFLLSLQLNIKSTYSIATINFSCGFGFNTHFKPRAVPADAANSWFLW